MLDANEDWVLKDKPEWMEFNRSSEVISGRAGDNVKMTPQMITQYKKNEITGFLTTESRSGAIAKAVSYTHLRAHETRHDLVCRLLLEKKKKKIPDSYTHLTLRIAQERK